MASTHENELLGAFRARQDTGRRKGLLDGLSAVANTISKDDTASDHSRQGYLLGGWAQKTQRRRSPLSQTEQGESATETKRRYREPVIEKEVVYPARERDRVHVWGSEKQEKLRRYNPVYYTKSIDNKATFIAKSDKKKSSSTKEKKEDKLPHWIPQDVVPPRVDLDRPHAPLAPSILDPMPDFQSDMMLADKYMADKYMDQSRKASSILPGISRSQMYDESPYYNDTEGISSDSADTEDYTDSLDGDLGPDDSSSVGPSRIPAKYYQRSRYAIRDGRTYAVSGPDETSRDKSPPPPRKVSRAASPEDYGDSKHELSIQMAKLRLEALEQRLEAAFSAGNHAFAADLQYGAMPQQRAILRELEADKGLSRLPYSPGVRPVTSSNIPHRYREDYTAYA